MVCVPVPRIPRRLSAVPLWLREIVLIGLLYGFYEVVRGLHHGPPAVALQNGWDILHWERVVHLDPEAGLTRALVHVTALAVPCAYFYSTMHYIVTPLVLIWVFRSHRDHYLVARTSLVVGTAVGLVLFWLVPTAPPRLLSGAHVPDALFDLRNWGWWGGDGSVPRGLGGITNQMAAMPSLHVGWSLWSGVLLALYARRTWVRVLGAVYPLLTMFVVLATGNHYLLDVLAGLAVMALGGLAALGAQRGVRALREIDARRAVRQHPGSTSEQIDERCDELVTTSRGA